MNGFAIWIGLGASLGLAWVAFRAERTEKISPRKVHRRVNAGLAFLAGALIGARLAYVLVNWGYFSAHLLEIPQVWLGGLAWPGAIAGSLVGLAAYARWVRTNLAALADQILPLALTLSLATWLACWDAGVAYGRLSESWLAVPARDEWGDVAMRFPLQLLAALLTLVVFWVLDAIRHRFHRQGQAASLALLFMAANLLTASFLRADPAPLWRNLRLDTWAGILFLGIGVCLCSLAFLWVPPKHLQTLDSNHLS